ncbi:MAG: response regulator transcription factor [Gammaproteobacteria bacterium]|nr:response regulator transcription factor [Gammaproteobacteria bacterium]
MRVLVVEDEPGIANFMRDGLAEAGYAVDVAVDGEQGLHHASGGPYDAIILDILLPKRDGLSLLKQLRTDGNRVPVLLLTAKDTIDDRIAGLDGGADDYLVKPFAFSELLARVRALLRRPPLQVGTELRVADMTMDLAQRKVSRAGKTIALSPREFSLLEYLMRNPRHVLTRTQIVERVWNSDFFGDLNVIEVYVGYLRRKINKPGQTALIQTVRGVGYRLLGDASDV